MKIQKIIMITLSILSILIVLFLVQKFFFKKESFQTKNTISKKLKDRLSLLQQNDKKKIKNDHQKKILIKKIEDVQNKTIEKFNPDCDDECKTYLRDKIANSSLCRSYFLPSMNIEKPSDFTLFKGFQVLKQYTNVADEFGGLVKVKTISMDNPSILTPNSLTNEVISTMTSLNNTKSIVEKISKSISGNVGGGFKGVSIQASFSYVTGSTHTENTNFQANQCEIIKETGLFGFDPDFIYDEKNYNSEFLFRLYELRNLNNNIKEDHTKILQFMNKYGSHIITDVSLGKKINLWDSINSGDTTDTNLLTAKGCASISYGGWVTCVPNNDRNPCGEGKYCAGFEEAKIKEGIEIPEKKGTCQSEGQDPGGFSIGGEVCASYTKENLIKSTFMESKSTLIISGASEEAQTGLVMSKINNVPVLDNSAVSAFMSSL